MGSRSEELPFSLQPPRVSELHKTSDTNFAAAVAEIVARGLRDTGALAVACDRLRVERRRPVPVDIHLPAHADDRDVVPHDLETYDDD